MEKLLSLSSSTEFLEQLSGGVKESRRRRRDIIPLPLFDRSINNNLRVRVEKSRVSWKGEREREKESYFSIARAIFISAFPLARISRQGSICEVGSTLETSCSEKSNR